MRTIMIIYENITLLRMELQSILMLQFFHFHDKSSIANMWENCAVYAYLSDHNHHVGPLPR